MKQKTDTHQHAYWNDQTNQRPYNHSVVKGFATQRIHLIDKLLPLDEVSSALDVGCGDGFGTYYMQSVVPHVYGCDVSAAMLRHNPVSAERLCQASAYCLPYQDDSFDLVYCWELLHHVEYPDQVLSEMKRVSREWVMLFEPNPLNPAQSLFGLLVPEERGLFRFRKSYVKDLLCSIDLIPYMVFTGGCFTPNKTPIWAYQVLRHFPYRWPWVGISIIAIGLINSHHK